MYRIMVADSDSYANEMLAVYLEIQGFDVRTYDNGLDAIADVGDYLPDIVLCESMLPMRSGFEVMRTVRKLTVLDHTQIILLTLKRDGSEIRQALEAGACDIITKPYVLEEVASRVIVNLNRRHYSQAA